MVYKNEKPNTSKPGYGKVLQGPWGQPARKSYDGGTNAVKHCPTCACGQHAHDSAYRGGAIGGLESALANMGLPGAAPVGYHIIAIYALPQQLLGGYEDLDAPAAARYDKDPRYGATEKKDNDSYGGDKGRYDTKRAA